MDSTLAKQLGELLLSAVPTLFIFSFLFWAYTVIVHRPLMKVLEERHSRTEGAVARAQADIAAAQARTAEYEQKLREARAGVFKAQEARRKQIDESRSAALAAVRKDADGRIQKARQEIGAEVASARTGLERESEALAQQVIQSVLRAAPATAKGAGA